MLKRAGIASMVFALGGAASLYAETSVNERIRALEETVAKQAEVIKQLQGKENESWLNSKRAQEVRLLIQEVLADADTRASLLEAGMAAGYDDDGFFIGSPDGQYLMKVGALLQTRYLWNSRDENGVDIDENISGFDIGRAEMRFAGHVRDIDYSLRIGHDFEDREAYIKEAYVAKDLTDTFRVALGGYRDNFTYEEQVESSNQLAVERSLVNEAFTNGHVLGVWTSFGDPKGPLGLTAGVHNGAHSFDRDESATFENNSDFAITGRVDYRILGGPDAWKDFTSWSMDEARLRIGGGIAYEVGETGTSDDNDKITKYTFDIGYEYKGFNIFGAYYGASVDPEDGDNQNQNGFVIQAGYNINDKFEPFIRYEYADLDGGSSGSAENDEISIVTAGFNYYCNRHNAKFTFDFLYALEPIPEASDRNTDPGEDQLFGVFPDSGDKDGQWVIRGQFQFMF